MMKLRSSSRTSESPLFTCLSITDVDILLLWLTVHEVFAIVAEMGVIVVQYISY